MTKKVVAFYGKVRIPTIGHKKAIGTAKTIANKVGGKLRIGLSGTSRPLTSETKKAHAEMMFQHPVDTGDEHSKNLFSYLSHLNQDHDELHLVAGSDRAPEYRRTLQDWNGRADKSGRVGFNFKKWKVHEVEGERGDVDKHPTKMSQDELERSVSATKLEGLAKSGDYEGFKAYHPGFPEKHVQKVYNQIRMSSSEEPTPKTVKQLRSKKVMKEELHDHGEMNHEKFGPMLDTFVQFASDKIGIKEMPTMKLQKEIMASSFGGYNPAEKSIVVITKNRHPMDIYRTVAHELVHHKQNEDGRLGKDIRKEGATGSPIENEANAEAGKVMRWFAKANPEMFKSGYVTESYIEEGLQDTGKAKAIFMGGGPGSGKDWIGDRAGLLAKGRKTGHGLTEINSDNALEHLMKMRGLDPMMPKEEDFERNVARGDAKKLTKEKERLALAGRRGVVINGTADDPEKIAKIKQQLEDLGYETKMLFVNTSNAVSRQRNLERGQQGGRKVPDGTDKNGRADGSPDIRGEKWEAAQESKDKLRKLFGDEHFVHVDNSEDYRTVDDKRKKEIDKAHNQLFKHYQQFVSTPAQTEKSKEWIEAEKKKRSISQYRPARATTVSQKKPVTPYVPNASELEQAKRLGVQHIGSGQFGSKEGATHVSRGGQLTSINEDLRKWFKQKWVRFDTKGNIKGDCAREPGEGKPKCRPMASAVAMGKEARAKAARRKRREDPVANRKGKGGKPVFVKTNEEVLMEKNVPTNPSLWARAKSMAKQKFDVYPSAYANGWASKWYKSKGGGWKSVSEGAVDEACWDSYRQEGMKKKGNRMVPNCVKVDEDFENMVNENTPSDREWGKSSLAKIYADATPGQTFPANPLFEKIKEKKKKLAQEDNTIPRGGIGQSGIGPETTVYRPMVASGFGGAGTIPMYESVIKWANDPKTQQRFIAKYGDLAEQKLNETVDRLNQLGEYTPGTKFFTRLREAWEAKGGRDMGTVLNSSSKEDMSEEEDDVIKPTKSLKGYKKHIHPMSDFEKKSLKEASSTPRQMPSNLGGDTGSKKITDFGAQAFRGAGDTARGVIDRRLFNRTTDKEYDKLIRATHAETSPKGSSRESSGEHAGIALSIANRAARQGGREGSINKVLNATNQFQAVTGTKRNPGPSREFREGPSAERKKDIENAIVQQGSSIPSNQVNFTAADKKAYKAGTDISWRTKLMRTGEVVGGSVFGTRRKADAEPGKVANWSDPNSIAKSEPKKADDKTLGYRPSQGFRPSVSQTPEAPKPEAPKVPEAPKTSTHTVARGQTSAGIARQYGMTLDQFRAANPKVKNLDVIQPGQQFSVNARPSTNRTPEASKAPEAPKVPTAPKSSTSGAVIADPNKDFGDKGGAWMQNWVDGQMRARQQRQQPAASTPPSARTNPSSSAGALSPEPMKKPQGPDATLGSQRTLRTPEPKVDNSAQQDDDAEKVRRETGAAAASAIRSADPVVSRMDPNSEMRKALTEPKGKANVFTGSRYGDQGIDEEAPAWQRKEGKNPEGGLNRKGVESYRRENPGSKLQTAVTTKPSKLKKGSKSAKRRLSFCRRMKGMKAKLTSAKTARDPDSRINKSLRKWNCEE